MGYNYLQRDNEELNYRGEQVVLSEPSVEHAPASCSANNTLHQSLRSCWSRTISSVTPREDQENLYAASALIS